MVISWPKGIKPDRTPRSQFHHVNDIAPTLYEVVGIRPPKVVDGYKQDPIDGVSLAYTFKDAKAPTRKKVQYFDNNGSRAIYQDGWVAATFGPLVPWLPGAPGLAEWDSAKDKWELYRHHQGFFAGRRSRREGTEAPGPAAEGVRRAGEGEQGLSARRRHLAAPAPRGPHQDALHELAVRRHHDAHARVHGAGPGP